MNITVNNVIISNLIFISILAVAILLSIRKKDNFDLLSISITQELKGLAILGVIFCHIGYFLSTDHNFLFPLSIIAGISLNLFLFLSGFGLTMSALKKDTSIPKFYKKNLLKLYTPFWISLIILFLMSFLVAHVDYSFSYIIKSLTGIFNTADIFHDINSPLWYFTFIIFYYLLFPLVFSKKKPWISAIIIFIITLIISKLNLNIIRGVNDLHITHILAFPIGMIFANILSNTKITEKIKNNMARMNRYFLIILSVIFVSIFALLAYFSGVGHGALVEQTVSIIAMLSLVAFFVIKKFEIKLFYILGLYSYEIYLIHWPIMYHYDFLYKYTPAWFATSLYIIIFLGLGFLLKKSSNNITKK
jgi:peptidoglycan/LPS O-acetylase OafA/YrhL